MNVELARVEPGVDVRAEAVERDVAEVEQPAPADHDVQAEREQHVEQRVERDPADVAAREHERDQRDERDEQAPPEPPGQAHEGVGAWAEEALALPPLLGAGDPLVAPDARFRAHTLLMSAFPSSPVGRTIIITIRIANTIRSDRRPLR